ncbi:NAD(P)H nitroreductase [Nocardia cyriacigeorgica]|uniref:NAD(P)H nitroreductase n=1 Tax=Nocardia cyriacigeorgica TaxID=135487 RepID=A0A6P1D2S9_9NOCA|nr:NAD(P)H nitroreductase [Nocardia cyriacigeorgica]NEW37681.1 NAD(P)H nitroreductase [Nocardia cyriacigeorgica]NEW43273.1 NAD(P)H nitroreductase [Nocardia cyriacigeorgica]NEW48932.1 NAD(P)H nitroreductase [Nocardia cyriacigeorgica]NEW55033.1 NAD(P)H nitroreductase [Nocardia cyriacigeorgica]
MDRGLPDDNTVKAVLALAGRAPSVHNVQPWRWRIAGRSIHLYLDEDRALPMTDPDRRDLILSCGAALHHLSVAFAAMGWSTVIHRLPNSDDPDHLAAVTLVGHRATSQEIEMSAAIHQRRTDRRHYTSWPIPPGYLGLLTERAASLGAILRPVRDFEREQLIAAARAAARAHAADPDYRFELAVWSGRRGSLDGVPARNTPLPRPGDELPARAFAAPELADPAEEHDYAELLMLGTSADDRMSRLRAGEALSAVLLTAANIGLATCALTEPLEIPAQRERIRSQMLNGTCHPQAFIRVGWAPTSNEPIPATPRRPVEELVFPPDVD